MKKGFMKWMLFSIASLLLSSCNGNTSNNSTIKEWKDDSIDDVVYDENGNVVFDNIELNMWSLY